MQEKIIYKHTFFNNLSTEYHLSSILYERFGIVFNPDKDFNHEKDDLDSMEVEAALLKEGFLNEALGSDIFSKAGRYKILLNINSLDK